MLPTLCALSVDQRRAELDCDAEQIQTVLPRDLATLPIPPSPVSIQPDQAWTYVNIDTIVVTDPDPGKPYPVQTVAYAYPQTGEYPVSLTTTRDRLTLVERRSRLVGTP